MSGLFLQIRLSALGLLCESPRTTESISELDLQLLQMFVTANMNNQSPSFRQQAAAQVKKVSTFGLGVLRTTSLSWAFQLS